MQKRTYLFAALSCASLLGTVTSSAHLYLRGFAGGSYLQEDSSKLVIDQWETDPVHQTNNRTAVMYGFGVGYHWSLLKSTGFLNSVELGLDGYMRDRVGSHGKGITYGMLDRFEFNMDVKSTRIMLDVKLNAKPFWHLSPFIMAGVGEAWNTATGYRETASPPVTGEGMRCFRADSETTDHFAYQLGAGVDLLATPQLSFGLGYLYANLGHFEVSRNFSGMSQPVIKAPSFSTRTQAVYASIQYTFQ